jgi:hypothetical protein
MSSATSGKGAHSRLAGILLMLLCLIHMDSIEDFMSGAAAIVSCGTSQYFKIMITWTLSIMFHLIRTAAAGVTFVEYLDTSPVHSSPSPYAVIRMLSLRPV